MSQDRNLTRRSLLGGLALLALPALAACGKRSRVKLPPERAGQATYPRAYPPPESVNPGAVRTTAPTPVEEPAPDPEDVGYEDSSTDPYYKPFTEFEEEEYR
jgi:hypothetical protein